MWDNDFWVSKISGGFLRTPYSEMRAPIFDRTSTPCRYGPRLSESHGIEGFGPPELLAIVPSQMPSKNAKNRFPRTSSDISKNRDLIEKSWREVLDISIYYRTRIDFSSPLSPCGSWNRSNSIHEFSVFEFVRTNRFRRNMGVDGRIFLFEST